jgi:uncharacterized protein YdbL (DUF1318 family)
MTRLLRILIVALAALLPLASASAQDSALAAAKAQGLVGEQPDGLIGAVSASPTAEIRALVERINRERMQLYAQVAQRNNATVPATQQVFGERLIRETPAGQFYRDGAGRWQRR